MLRTICNYFRQCACKHEFVFLTMVKTTDPLVGTEHRQTYRCKKVWFCPEGKVIRILILRRGGGCGRKADG